MKNKTRTGTLRVFRYLGLLLVIIFGLATILATGGGSPTSSIGTGSVALFLKDGPADDYDNIWMWVTEVSIIPPEGSGRSPVVIYQSRDPRGYRVDLLAYRDWDFLLTLRHRVPVGLYEKVRLKVSNIVSEGGECDLEMIKIPSGKIDLNPREQFEVRPGETLTIRLDIDANKSINFHPAGKSGKCIFRPVVFVDIEPVRIPKRCPLIVRGEIIEVFDRNNDEIIEGFKLDLDGARGSLEVRVLRDTVVFDEEGFPLPSFATTDDLGEDDMVWVRGRLDEDGRLNASVVVKGEVLVLKGTVQNSPDAEREFSLFLDADQAITDETVKVKVFEDASLILFGCDTEASLEDILRGVHARVVGKYGDGVLRAAVVFLKPEAISGDLVSVDDAEGGKALTIQTNEGDNVDVFMPANTPIYLYGDGEVPIELLCEGRNVRVFLDPEKPVLTAAEVQVQDERLEGQVESTNEMDRTLIIDGQTVFMQPGATILDLRGEEEFPIDFDEIKSGDELKCFGLTACPGDLGFYAFVILVVEPKF
jgi:hypothetical protein